MAALKVSVPELPQVAPPSTDSWPSPDDRAGIDASTVTTAVGSLERATVKLSVPPASPVRVAPWLSTTVSPARSASSRRKAYWVALLLGTVAFTGLVRRTPTVS